MANNYNVSATELREGTPVLVDGELVFARISKVVEGEALAKSDATRVSNGMRAIGVPHTSITLANAEVRVTDPNGPTKEDNFVSERRYTSAKHPDRGLQYTIDNKSNQLPVIYQLGDDGTYHQVNPLKGELASGTKVTIALRVYKPKSYDNRGLSLDQVLINQAGPTPYYSGGAGASTSALEAAGITFAAAPTTQVAADGSTETVGAPEGSIDHNGFAFPGPGSDEDDTPAAAPAPTAAAAAPAAPTAPAPAAAAPHQETEAEELARLRAQVAQSPQGQNSPFSPQGQGISYQGR